MNVIVACEFSGIVRNAFAARGHYAVSVDLLPSETPGNHWQGDARVFLKRWAHLFDLMIAHPPCTYLSGAGAHLWPYNREEIIEAFKFVKFLYHCPVHRVAIENPQGWMNTYWRKPDQVFNPYHFGEPYKKRTCLWLRGLRPLTYTDHLHGVRQSWVNSTNNYRNRFGEGHTIGVARSQKERSRSFVGVASAMAEQWGSLL